MEAMNLNGRIVGKTEDGRLLVALTTEEYLDALPVVFLANQEKVAEPILPAAPEVPPQRDGAAEERTPTRGRPPALRPGGDRPSGKATPAQRRFNGTTREVGETRTCVVCGAAYSPVRKDQKTCAAPACKYENKKRLLLEYRAAAKAKREGGKPAQTAPAAGPAKLTPAQKWARLNMICNKMR